LKGIQKSNMKHRTFFLIVWIIFLSVFTYAQKPVTTSEILASAKNQYLIKLERQRLDFLKNNNPKLPIVDELEFRTETNEFNIRQQRYALRGRFFTKEQREAQANLNRAKIDLQSIEEEIILNDLLYSRYIGILETLYFDQLLDAKNEEKILLEDKMTVLKKNLNSKLAAREQAILQAKEDNTFEFFQARIGGTNDRGFRENFRLALGIRIPVRNREELDIVELEFEKLDEQMRYDELKYKLKKRMNSVRLRIENNFRIYQLLKLQIENSQSDQVLEQYQKIAGTSPFAMLKLKGNKFKKELELFQIEQDLYLDYIEMLDASGKLMELPLRNYLDADLNLIP